MIKKDFRMEEEDAERIDLMLKELGISFSEYIRELIARDNGKVVKFIQQEIVMTDEWYTPKYVIDTFRDMDWNFTLDVATTKEQLKVLEINDGYTIDENALDRFWDANGGDIWINPPFSKQNQFITQARRVIDIEPSQRILMLLPYKPDSKIWKEHINGRCNVFIPEDKIIFTNPEKETITYGGQGKIVLVELLDYESNNIEYIKLRKE